MLELIRAGQITALQHLIDLPVQPERCLIQQGSVLTRTMLFEELIRVLAGGQLQHPQLQLTLQSKLFHLTDGALGSAHTGAIGVEIEDQPFAIAAPAQLGDLLAAKGRAKGCHSIGDAGGMEGNHIEIALHHHSAIVFANRIHGLIEAKEVLPFLKHLRFGGVEVLGLTAIEAAATEADDPPLPIADGHHHAMAKTVVEAIATPAWHHQTGRFQQLRVQPFHLLQMVEQPIPTLRGVPQTEALQRGFAETALLT